MTYEYILSDDNGTNNIDLPIVLNVGSQFEHEFGLYKVSSIEQVTIAGFTVPVFWCDRIDDTQHLTEAITTKRKDFEFKNPNT